MIELDPRSAFFSLAIPMTATCVACIGAVVASVLGR
jgi:hypothetical protein